MREKISFRSGKRVSVMIKITRGIFFTVHRYTLFPLDELNGKREAIDKLAEYHRSVELCIFANRRTNETLYRRCSFISPSISHLENFDFLFFRVLMLLKFCLYLVSLILSVSCRVNCMLTSWYDM